MFKKLKEKVNDFVDWWKDDSMLDVSNGEAAVGSFMFGSGLAAWCYIAILAAFLAITGQKLDIVKK